MKRTWIIISVAAATIGFSPISAWADHDKDCKAVHGTVSAKTDNSITVNGKTYNLGSSTTVARENGETASLATVKTGDKVCIETASSGSTDATKLMVMDRHSKVASARDDRTYSADSSDRVYAHEKLSEVDRKAHEAMCKGHHGTVTDKTANTVTIDGKSYAFAVNTPVTKQEEALLPKTIKVGDRVCFDTRKAADGSMQLSKMMAIDKDADAKVRVRERESDSNEINVKSSPDKVEVETPNKKIEVK